MHQKNSRIIVTCANRVAPFLEREVLALGFRPAEVFKTGLGFTGSFNDAVKLCLHLRTAGQVLFSLGRFRIRNADELYRAASTITWEHFINADGYFSVTGNVSNETITNSLFANVKLKDAIVDRMRDKTGSRPDSGSLQDQLVIHLFWRDDEAEIFIGMAGETLSKHGYRKIPGKAPMIEALAAAVVLATGYGGTMPFVNPMCGSGTLAIEAALIASQRPPSLFRNNYSFMHLRDYNDAYRRAEMTSIKAAIRKAASVIIATDISEDAVNIARINAEAAGVADMIRFESRDFRDSPVPEGRGIVIFNPEYGDRLGAEKDLEELYGEIGDFLKKKCGGYTGYIFSGNPELAKKIGLKASRRIEFFNGKIDCRLLKYELYAGSKRAANTA